MDSLDVRGLRGDTRNYLGRGRVVNEGEEREKGKNVRRRGFVLMNQPLVLGKRVLRLRIPDPGNPIPLL